MFGVGRGLSGALTGGTSGHEPDVRFLTRGRAIRLATPPGGGADDRQAAIQFLGGDDGRDRSMASDFSGADQRCSENDERATREP